MQILFLVGNLVFTLTVRYLIISCHQKILFTVLAKANSPKIGQFSYLLVYSKYINCLRENPQESKLYSCILTASGLHTAGKVNRHTRDSLAIRVRLVFLFCFGGMRGFCSFEPSQIKAAHTSETDFFWSMKHTRGTVSDVKEKGLLCSYCSLFVILSSNRTKDFRTQANPLIITL